MTGDCIVSRWLDEGRDYLWNNLASAFIADFSYNDGHTIICPDDHIESIDDIDKPTGAAMYDLALEVARRIKDKLNPAYLMIYQNSGLLEYEIEKPTKHFAHVHIQVVPSYKGREIHTNIKDVGKRWIDEEARNGMEDLLRR